MKRQFTGNTGKIVLHALAWIIIIILPQFLSGRYFGNNRFFTWWFFVNTSTYLVIFYVNYLILVPRFFFSDKRLVYYLSALLLLVSVYFLTEFANETFFRRQRNERMMALQQSQGRDTLQLTPDQFTEERRTISSFDGDTSQQNANITTGRSFRYTPDSIQTRRYLQADSTGSAGSSQSGQGFGPPPPDNDDRGPGRPPSDFRRLFRLGNTFQVYNYALTALFFTFFSLGLKFMERHAGIEKRQKELEKEKLDSELALLKNQISPHFFFNTLNNIYSLIAINTHDSQEAVLKLSKLMRYLLYESEQGQTKLSNEIDFMVNYIDLMRLRMSEKVNLSIHFPEDYDNLSIPPLLFIPFIENAFKHGISYRGRSFISISMSLERNKLVFRCRNSLGTQTGNDEEQHSGIGLDNVTKRLNLLFSGNHLLKIEKTAGEFQVLLEIETKQLKNDDQNDSNRR